jgi:DNA replication protein
MAQTALPMGAESAASSPGSEQASSPSPARGGGRGERFPGFPAGARATVVPSLFFSAVLPQIDDPAELVVSSYLFFALGRKKGYPRYITLDELAAEAPLRRALGRLADGGIEQALRRGLEAAVTRGTVLQAWVAAPHPGRERQAGPGSASAVGGRAEPVRSEIYLLHTEAAREALASGRLAGIELPPAPEPLPHEPPPTIYALYEENIGTISPLIAEDLREVEASYPITWILAAFKEAVSMNKRNWRYVIRILERWRAEGRTDATVGRDLPGTPRRRDLEGRYRNLVRR